MSRPPYEIAHLSQLDEIPGPGSLTWRPIRRRFDIRSFGVNAYTAAAGQDVVEEHTEVSNGHEELYVVIAGRARFLVGEEQMDAPAGTLVFLRDPGTRRGAQALEDGTTVLAIGGKPGEPFKVSGWEWGFVAKPLSDAGRHDEAIAVATEGVAAQPESPWGYYNLACYEALGGRPQEALAHLRRAIELEPKAAEYAREDSDFDSIRALPGFPA